MKCVIVINETLPLGLIANTATVLGICIGQRVPDLLGPDVVDGSGGVHAGIVTVTVPILRADAVALVTLRQRASEAEDLTLFDFAAPAQESRTYPDYQERMAATPADELAYLGIGLYGAQRTVKKLTGNLALLR
jgi:hypothetical protein